MKKIKQILGTGVLSIVIASLVIGQAACTASQISTAEQLTSVLLQDVPQILTLLAGFGVLSTPQLAQAKAFFGQAAADYSTVKTLITDFKTTPSATTAQKINAAIIDAQTNLTAILTAFHVSNPQSQEKLSALINLSINTGEQIAALFPPAVTPVGIAHAKAFKFTINAKQFDAEFHQILNQ